MKEIKFKKIIKFSGISRNLFIQDVDQSLFDKEMTIDQILNEVHERNNRDFHTSDMAMCYNEDENSVIVVDYTFPKKEGGLA